jgi:hypothetical protein
MPDNDAAGGSAPGGGGDDAAWLDLIARFDAPAAATDDGAAPWPEREDLTEAVQVTPVVPETPVVPDVLPFDPPANPPAGHSGLPEPPRNRIGAGYGPRDAPAPDNPADEHYVPPPPPPLPKLDPATKLAWLALFGGPCYLLVATAVGWAVSGLAAFLAVAAFVGGFAVLVLRMDNGGPRDSGPDDGAVV